MLVKKNNVSVSGTFILILVITSILFIKMAYIHNSKWYLGLLFSVPSLLIVLIDARQSKHAFERNYKKQSKKKIKTEGFSGVKLLLPRKHNV